MTQFITYEYLVLYIIYTFVALIRHTTYYNYNIHKCITSTGPVGEQGKLVTSKDLFIIIIYNELHNSNNGNEALLVQWNQSAGEVRAHLWSSPFSNYTTQEVSLYAGGQ